MDSIYPMCTFGKYKANKLHIDELPKEYLEWLSTSFSDVYIKTCALYALRNESIPPDPAQFVILSFMEPDIITIDAPYCLKTYIKELPYRMWNPDIVRWVSKLEFYDDIIDTFPDATVQNKLKKALHIRSGIQTTLEYHNFSRDAIIDTTLPLRDYQRVALQFLLSRTNSMLALDMGLGKTIVALEYLLNTSNLPVLVICPAIVKNVWRDEIEHWTDQSYEILSSKKPHQISDSDIIIINYDILTYWEDELKEIPFKTLIVDESHYLKSSTTKRTRAVVSISKSIDHKILLTGTPIINRTGDLFSQLNIIAPETFDNYFAFTTRYSNGHHKINPDTEASYWDASGSSNTEELKNRLYNTIIFRREKKDVLPELPPKISQEIYFDVPERYFSIQGEDLESLTEKIMFVATAKINPTIKFLTELLTNVKPVLFYTMHTDYLHEVCKKLKAPYIDGSVTGTKRDRLLSEFKHGNHKLLGANALSLGIGVSLDNCCTVVMGESPFTPAQNDQAVDRVHRMTTTKTVNIYYLLMPGTIDYQIKRIVIDKRQVIDSVLDIKRLYS